MLPFLWATLSFQKNVMSLQKYPNWQKIAQSGHPAVVPVMKKRSFITLSPGPDVIKTFTPVIYYYS
jgi:hypothetical protein